jgi:hypothetical protein
MDRKCKIEWLSADQVRISFERMTLTINDHRGVNPATVQKVVEAAFKRSSDIKDLPASH